MLQMNLINRFKISFHKKLWIIINVIDVNNKIIFIRKLILVKFLLYYAFKSLIRKNAIIINIKKIFNYQIIKIKIKNKILKFMQSLFIRVLIIFKG